MKKSLLLASLFAFGAQPSFGADASTVREISIGLASNFSELSSSSSNPYGDYFRNGLQLAIKDSKTRLLAKSISIKLTEFDYGTRQVGVLDAAKRAVESPVIGVLGYNFSSHALLAAPIHQKAGLPMLTPSASADRIGQLGAYVHTASFDNSFMGKTLARVATARLKAKSAAIVVAVDCAYCQDLARAFEREFAALGGNISASISILEADKDFSKAIETLRGKPHDVILVPNQELTSARVISALLKANVRAPFLGGDGWGNVGEEFFAILGGQDLQGFSVSHWHANLKSERTWKFIRDYQAEFKKMPNDTSVLAYDSMLLLIEALLRAKSHTRAGLESALTEIRNFEGITGKFLFRKGAAPQKSMVLLRANKTKFQVLELIPPSSKVAQGGALQ